MATSSSPLAKVWCKHEHTIRQSNFGSGFGSCTCALDTSYLAAVHNRQNVGLWHIGDPTTKYLELIGHRKQITSLCLGTRNQSSVLCSCADDYIIVWNILQVEQDVAEGKQTRGTIIGTTLGTSRFCTFNAVGSQVAVCIGRLVLILSARCEQLEATLEGHTAQVTAAQYSPHYPSLLLSCAEDRQYKIWDLSAGALLYQSSIISSSPFVSAAMDCKNPSFALGTVDGQIRIYDLTEGNGYRLLHHIDVVKTVHKLSKVTQAQTEAADTSSGSAGGAVISSFPSWQQQSGTTPTATALHEGEMGQEGGGGEEEGEAGLSVLAMSFCHVDDSKQQRRHSISTPVPPKLSFLNADHSIAKELLALESVLVVVTSGAVLVYNAKTLAINSHCNLLEPIPTECLEEDEVTIGIITSAVLEQNNDQVICVVTSLLGHEIHILRIDIANQSHHSLATSHNMDSMAAAVNGDSSSALSVLSCVPLLSNSPLKAELLPKVPSVKVKKRPAGLPTGRSNSLTDQPLTFHDKVSSTGYSTAPRRDRFKPKINQRKGSPSLPAPRSRSSSASKSSPSTSSPVFKEYPMNSDPPTVQALRLDVAERPTAISTIKFSGNGQHLACSLANTTAQIFKMPLNGKGRALTGHNGSVTCTSWSHDNRWVVTSSDDKTAAVWSLAIPDPLLTVQLANNNFGADKEGGLKPSKDNQYFSSAVRFAQFYYMDKFILLTSGSSVHLYKYHLDTSKSDIKRYVTNNRYKLVNSFTSEQSSTITAFSAVNSFHSYLVFAGRNNRTLDIFDMNEGKCIRTMTDTHTRAPHAIQHNTGSSFTSNSSCNYDLFATAAASDCIKLWDLRSNRCVQRYEGHYNRTHPCGFCFSPCSRFLATASEDRSAYIYDLRGSTYLHKLTGHTETVGDVAFHPLKPEIVTASLDGRLRLFRVK